MGKSIYEERERVSDGEDMPSELDPVRQVSVTEVEEALSHVRIVQERPSGRWTARSADYKHFSAQGRTEEECWNNARTNMKWYLERKPERRG